MMERDNWRYTNWTKWQQIAIWILSNSVKEILNLINNFDMKGSIEEEMTIQPVCNIPLGIPTNYFHLTLLVVWDCLQLRVATCGFLIDITR